LILQLLFKYLFELENPKNQLGDCSQLSRSSDLTFGEMTVNVTNPIVPIRNGGFTVESYNNSACKGLATTYVLYYNDVCQIEGNSTKPSSMLYHCDKDTVIQTYYTDNSCKTQVSPSDAFKNPVKTSGLAKPQCVALADGETWTKSYCTIPSSPPKKDDMPLILGLAVGLGGGAVVVGLGAYVYTKSAGKVLPAELQRKPLPEP